MLIILTFGLVIASILLILLKKDSESKLLLGLCISLMIEIVGMMIFIAKKGGISPEVVQFLYFSRAVENKLQYLLITLSQLGYMIAIGRILFPLFLLELALNYSMIPAVRESRFWQKAMLVIPAAMLILYFPVIYRMLVVRWENFQRVLEYINLVWITVYILVAIAVLLIEYYSITMKFCRRQFSQIIVFLVCITAIYFLYYRQDPGQVYRFYGYTSVWNKGVGYLQIHPTVFSYMLLVIVNLIGAILGFFSLFRFTRGTYEENMENVVMERKFDTVRIGVSMFVHSMKNQLLSTKVIYKRIDQLYNQPELDTVKLKQYIDSLQNVNDLMLTRIEELYRSVKSNSITMVPVEMSEILDTAVEHFHEKYPEVSVCVENEGVSMILADKIHFCEALYNLLINGQEAIIQADRKEGKLCLHCKNERLYTVIEVRDNGKGMNKIQKKKIFDPFYSSKNSNFNWGMGLYYVREIVKSHLGSIRVESEEGKGSSFFILLPKYQ